MRPSPETDHEAPTSVKSLLPAAAALLAVIAIPRAGAQPFTDRLDDLADAVVARNADLTGDEEAKQRRALERCFQGLQRPGRSEDGDLALAARMAGTLEGAFPGDPEFDAALDGAFSAFRGDIDADRDKLAGFLDLMSADRPWMRGAAGLESMDSHLAAADASPTRARRALFLRKALRAGNSAWDAALDLRHAEFHPVVRSVESFAHASFRTGRGLVAATVDGGPFVSHATQAYYGARSHTAVLLGVEILDPIQGRNRVLLLAVNGLTGTGTFPLGYGAVGESWGAVMETLDSGLSYDYTTFFSPYTGTLNVTVFDPDRRLVEGTFSFEALSVAPPPGDETRTVTSGSFGLQVRWDARR